MGSQVRQTRALRPHLGDNKHDKRLNFNLAVECVTAGFLVTIAETTLVLRCCKELLDTVWVAVTYHQLVSDNCQCIKLSIRSVVNDGLQIESNTIPTVVAITKTKPTSLHPIS